MTPHQLLKEILASGCLPTAIDGELSINGDLPEHLEKPLDVLHTGIRAILTGTRWFGIDCSTGHATGPDPLAEGKLAYGALDTNWPLPENTGLICCEGDELWDRLPPWALDECPDLFGPPVTRKSRTHRKGGFNGT